MNSASRLSKIHGAVLLVVLLAARVQPANLPESDRSNYRLGPDDQIAIRVTDLEKLQLDNAAAPRVDVNGNLNLPIIGHVHAAGLTVNELEKEITLHLGNVLQQPNVSASIVQYRSHPISVLGSVRSPGVIQVAHPKRLLEVISLAGGLAPEAGHAIKVSRRNSGGPLPVRGSSTDSAGNSVGQIDVRSLLEARDPDMNIEMVEGDVVTVPRAELIYVIGAVKKAGGFTLGERDRISVLQAISLAEGLDRTASAKSAKVLREDQPGADRQEIDLDLRPILKGLAPDVRLRANDILFIPTSAARQVSIRSLEAAVQLGTGLVIFR